MRACNGCGEPVSARFRYCPWCAAPQRLKLVDFFRAHPAIEGGRDRALRVSRYLGPAPEQRHVRFSVWNEDGRAESAVSLGEAEAARLARFLADPAGSPPAPRVASLVRHLRVAKQRLLDPTGTR